MGGRLHKGDRLGHSVEWLYPRAMTGWNEGGGNTMPCKWIYRVYGFMDLYPEFPALVHQGLIHRNQSCCVTGSFTPILI